MGLDAILRFGSDPLETDDNGYLECLPADMLPARQKELTDAALVMGLHRWSLSPDAQSHNTQADYNDRGRKVVKSMLGCISLRRGMDTITNLPDHADGTKWQVCPWDGIPPHHIETHELEHVAMKPEVDRIMKEDFNNL